VEDKTIRQEASCELITLGSRGGIETMGMQGTVLGRH